MSLNFIVILGNNILFSQTPIAQRRYHSHFTKQYFVQDEHQSLNDGITVILRSNILSSQTPIAQFM